MSAPRRDASRFARGVRVASLVLLAGCSAQDVLLGAGNPPPDAAVAPPDDGGGAFGAPVMLEGISSPDTTDDDPSLTADRALLYFNSEREGGAGEEDIWFSRREVGGGWSTPVSALELNTEDRETGIALSGDGLAIWWSSDRPGGAGGLDIYTARRGDRDAAWSALERVAELSTEGDDLISNVDDALQLALLARRDDGDDDYDLFVAQRTGLDGPWQAAEPLAELNSEEGETDAFLLADQRRIVFTRDRDLVVARRPALDQPFSAPEPLRELNSDADDRDAWVAPDFDYVIFASDRAGSYALYEAFR